MNRERGQWYGWTARKRKKGITSIECGGSEGYRWPSASGDETGQRWSMFIKEES